MYTGKDFSEMNPSEEIPLTIDFVNDIPPDIAINSATFTSSVLRGEDADGANKVTGSITINGTKVTRKVKNVVGGVLYRLEATATLADNSKYTLFTHVLGRDPD